MVKDLNNSRPFDVHRWSDHPEVNSFVNSLWLSGFGSLLESKRGPKSLASLKNQFKVVLLDLYL